MIFEPLLLIFTMLLPKELHISFCLLIYFALLLLFHEVNDLCGFLDVDLFQLVAAIAAFGAPEERALISPIGQGSASRACDLHFGLFSLLRPYFSFPSAWPWF